MSLEMEAVVNGYVAAKRPSARSTTLDADAARDLLNYLEIDENEKEFLISAITSSKAHEDEQSSVSPLAALCWPQPSWHCCHRKMKKRSLKQKQRIKKHNFILQLRHAAIHG